MDLRFDFEAPTRSFALFFLTFNMLVKRHSDFLALGVLTGIDVMGTVGLLYVTSYGVDTISAYIISLRFFWYSHLPAC